MSVVEVLFLFSFFGIVVMIKVELIVLLIDCIVGGVILLECFSCVLCLV